MKVGNGAYYPKPNFSYSFMSKALSASKTACAYGKQNLDKKQKGAFGPPLFFKMLRLLYYNNFLSDTAVVIDKEVNSVVHIADLNSIAVASM